MKKLTSRQLALLYIVLDDAIKASNKAHSGGRMWKGYNELVLLRQDLCYRTTRGKTQKLFTEREEEQASCDLPTLKTDE